MKKVFSTISLILLVVMSLSAQSALVGTGGEASGSGGSVSYSVGQIAVQSNSEGSTSISEGVQQPFTERDRAQQGIGEIAVRMSVYPNPTADNVVLECDETAGQLIYTLFGTNGQVLQQGTYKGGQHQIALEQYGAGNYMLQVATPDKSKMNVYKIIKAK